MLSSDCPYCSQATKKGELFCSQHDKDMSSLKSGVFCITTDKLEECDWHVTRLSLNFNLDGPQVYQAGSRSFTIRPESFLLINEGQRFKTSSDSRYANRMITIAFKTGLAASIMSSLTMGPDHALDNPFRNSSGNAEFFEKTYSTDAVVSHAVASLVDVDVESEALDQALENLLVYILQKQLDLRKEVLSISKCKVSTKIEIFRRLQWSMDFLRENFASGITVDNLAAEACLSAFHYKRLFTEVFKTSPYQYLINLRLEKSQALLKEQMMVADVCRAVGWKDPSSFTRLFKKRFATTPQKFRNEVFS